MKTILTVIVLFFICSVSYGQRSDGIVISQGVTNVTPNPPNMVWVDTVGATSYKWKLARKDSLRWFPHNMRWLNDTIISVGNSLYPQLSVPYSNPNFVNTLSAAKVFGLSSVALTGQYSDLSGTPNLSLYYLNSNPSGFISFITSGDVIGALGYPPLSSSDLMPYVKYIDTPLMISPYLRKVDTIPAHSLFVPLARTITINGTALDLSNNRSFSVGTLIGTDTLSLNNRINLKLNASDSNILYQTKYRADTSRTQVYTAISGKFNNPSGTTLQYLNGVGTPVTFPTIPPQQVTTAGQNTKVTGSYPNITIADSFTARVYTSAGFQGQNIKTFVGTYTPNTSSGYNVDISAAGFGSILSVQLTAFENVATEKGVLVSGKTKSTTAVTVNFYRSKLTPILLGGNVEGLELHPTPANISFCITVIGY